MRRLRVVRADLGRFPADALILPTEGSFRHLGVAGAVAEALRERFGADLAGHAEASLPWIPPGQAAEVPPLPGMTEGLPRLICVNGIRGGGASTEAIVGGLERGLALAESRSRDRPWRVAVPAIGAGVGQLSPEQSAQAMRPAIEQWLDTAGDEELCLVLWERASHRVFLAAYRHRLSLDPSRFATLGDDLRQPGQRDALEHLDRCLRGRERVLFVGSGLSFNAAPPKPSWTGLFDPSWLPAKPEAAYLPDYAQIAVDTHGRPCVEERFLTAVGAPSLPSPLHYALLSLPWAAVVTTNYDTLIERTLEALRLRPIVVTHDEQVVDLDSRGVTPVIKLHGGLCADACALPHASRGDHSSPAHVPLVATRDDYDRFFEDRPAIAAYLEAKLLTARGLIVGYSVTDPHLRGLFARIGGVLARGAPSRLICLSTERSPIEAYWQKRGLTTLVVPLGSGRADNFADFIHAAVDHAWLGLADELLPEDLLAERQAALLDGLDEGVQRRVVRLLVDAGCRVPPALDRLLAGAGDRPTLDIPPERASWAARSQGPRS